MKKSREAYEVSEQAAYDEWSIFDSCDIDGSYPGECEHGIEHFVPRKVAEVIYGN